VAEGCWYAVCGMRYAVCGMRYAVCGMRYAVCGADAAGKGVARGPMASAALLLLLLLLTARGDRTGAVSNVVRCSPNVS
jgi:hypothetical protein